MKRNGARAIIFKNDALMVMHRIKKDSEYYVLPGGGLEEDETYEKCAKREVMEEFGIEVDVKKLVYKYETEKGTQYFYLCQYVCGIFGSGMGPEMINYLERKGHYIPTLQKICELDEIVLEPKIVADQLKKDILEYGLVLGSEVKKIIE